MYFLNLKIKIVNTSVRFLVALRAGQGPFETHKVLGLVFKLGEEQLSVALDLKCRGPKRPPNVEVKEVLLDEAPIWRERQRAQH